MASDVEVRDLAACVLDDGVEHESQSFEDRGRVLRDKLCSPIRNFSLD